MSAVVDICNPRPFWLKRIDNFLEVTLFPLTIDVPSLTVCTVVTDLWRESKLSILTFQLQLGKCYIH